MNKLFILIFGCMVFATNSFATPASDSLMQELKQAGATDGNAETGKALWTEEKQQVAGKGRSCSICHGTDLTQAGEHQRTHKVIEPMAPSVNAERFTEVAEMKKWFKRNCKWTWGRECTAQEQMDILTFLLSQ